LFKGRLRSCQPCVTFDIAYLRNR